jgi:hypothetical protein
LRVSLFPALVFALVALSLGCSSGDKPSLVGPSWQALPRVPGIYVTSNSNPDPIAVIGEPNSTLFPYPNPFNGTTEVGFRVPTVSQVSIWVVRALGPGEEAPEAGGKFLGADISPTSATTILWSMSSVLVAGYHRVILVAHDDAGNLWPDGYYRVYVKIGDQDLQWGDVLVIYDPYHSKCGSAVIDLGL